MAKKVKRLADGGEVGGRGLKLNGADMKIGSLDGVDTKPATDAAASRASYVAPLGESKGFASGFANGVTTGDSINRAEGQATFASKAREAAGSLKASLGMADGGKVGGGRFYGKK